MMKHKKAKIDLSKETRLSPKLSPIATMLRFCAVGIGLTHAASQAATIEVTSNQDDSTACTMREAIVSINTESLQDGCSNISADLFGTNDTIVFNDSLASTNTIALNQGEISLGSADVAISASNISGGITIDAQGNSRGFNIAGGGIASDTVTITLDNINISNGVATAVGIADPIPLSAGNGGAIFIAGAVDLTLSNCLLSNNAAVGPGNNVVVRPYNNFPNGLGGAIMISGNLVPEELQSITGMTIDNCRLEGNSAYDGGALFMANQQGANITINRSTFDGNTAANEGGAIGINDSRVTINTSTISNNVANTDIGGGIVLTTRSSLALNNSTVSGNAALGAGINGESTSSYRGNGGGIGIAGSAVTLNHSTISNNTSTFGGGGLIGDNDASITLNNSIIANSLVINGDDNDIDLLDDSMIDSDGASIIEQENANFGNRTGDPGLLPLADNGGPTLTHALSDESIARNSGIAANCELFPFDQTGAPRLIVDNTCDLGSAGFVEIDFFVVPLRDNNGAAVFPL